MCNTQRGFGKSFPKLLRPLQGLSCSQSHRAAWATELHFTFLFDQVLQRLPLDVEGDVGDEGSVALGGAGVGLEAIPSPLHPLLLLLLVGGRALAVAAGERALSVGRAQSRVGRDPRAHGGKGPQSPWWEGAPEPTLSPKENPNQGNRTPQPHLTSFPLIQLSPCSLSAAPTRLEEEFRTHQIKKLRFLQSLCPSTLQIPETSAPSLQSLNRHHSLQGKANYECRNLCRFVFECVPCFHHPKLLHSGMGIFQSFSQLTFLKLPN